MKFSESTDDDRRKPKKMPMLRSRPAFGETGRDKMPRRSEPLRISKSASSTDLVKGSTNTIVVDRRGESGKPIEMDIATTLHRKALQVLVPAPGTDTVAAVNVKGVAGGAQRVQLRSWGEPLR